MSRNRLKDGREKKIERKAFHILPVHLHCLDDLDVCVYIKEDNLSLDPLISLIKRN